MNTCRYCNQPIEGDPHKTLQSLFRQLGRMAELQPSLISTPAWQMACEGTARLMKQLNEESECKSNPKETP